MSVVGSGALFIVAVCVSACAGPREHAPMLQDETSCSDGGCTGTVPPTDSPDGGDGGPPGCIPSSRIVARGSPVTGTVVELDDYTFELSTDQGLHYANATPLKRKVSVEALGAGGCTVVKATPAADGTFSLSGAVPNGYVRIVPVGEPAFMTSIFVAPDGGGAKFPLVSRASLTELFAITGKGLTPDPQAGQVVVTVIDALTTIGYSGATLTCSAGAVAYDGAKATSGLGLATVENATAVAYPGARIALELQSPPRPVLTWNAVVAKDAVTVLAATFH